MQFPFFTRRHYQPCGIYSSLFLNFLMHNFFKNRIISHMLFLQPAFFIFYFLIIISSQFIKVSLYICIVSNIFPTMDLLMNTGIISDFSLLQTMLYIWLCNTKGALVKWQRLVYFVCLLLIFVKTHFCSSIAIMIVVEDWIYWRVQRLWRHKIWLSPFKNTACARKGFIFAPGTIYYKPFISTVPLHSTLGEPVALSYMAPDAGPGTVSNTDTITNLKSSRDL